MGNFHDVVREQWGPEDPRRVFRFSIPDVKHAPIADETGTGTVVDDTTLSDGTVNETITVGMQPTCLRELVIGQEDDSGTNLSVTWTISYKTWDGSNVTVTKTLTGDAFYAFPLPVSKITSISYAIANSATDDHILCGYRGIFVEGVPITPTGELTLLQESVAGDAPSTAGTFNSAGYYVPNSLSSGNNVNLLVRYSGREPQRIRSTTSTVTQTL